MGLRIGMHICKKMSKFKKMSKTEAKTGIKSLQEIVYIVKTIHKSSIHC
jgi:hypothetical protein